MIVNFFSLYILFYLCTNVRLFVILFKICTPFLKKKNGVPGTPLYWSDGMIELVQKDS